jgi:hypothetical protein
MEGRVGLTRARCSGSHGSMRFMGKWAVLRASRGVVSVCASCVCVAGAAACGGGGTTSQNDNASDSGSGSNGSSDASIAPPGAVAGQWWGWLPFGSPLASASTPVLVAFEVDPAPGGAVTTAWPARFWVGGQATDLRVSAADPSASTFIATGAAPFSVTCGVAATTPAIVPNGNTLSLRIDASGCGGSATEVVGTLTRSSAQRIQLGIQRVSPAAISPDGQTLAYAVANHPWLWDEAHRSLVDMAPSVADGGAVGTGTIYVALAPGDGHAIYCSQGGSTGSALVDFDVARGVAEPIDTGVGCDARELVFSADGDHLAYTVLTSNQAAVDLRVRDFTHGKSVTAYHGIGTQAPYWFWAGATGRYLVYYATTSTSLGVGGQFYTPLEVYDAQTGQTQSLGQARYLTASPDGRFLAFSRSDGKLAIWDERAGAASAIDTLADQGATGSYITFTNNIEYVPLGLSPDGLQLLYVDAAYSLRLLAFGSTTPRTAGASIGCGSGSTPTGTGTGVFSVDSKFLGYFSARGCSGSTPPAYAAHALGLASSNDLSVNLPVQADQPAPGAVSPSGTMVYEYEINPGSAQVHVWSPAVGDIVAQPNGGTLDDPMFGISHDGNRVFFRQSGTGAAQTDMLWDRTMGLRTLGLDQSVVNPDFPLDFFLPIFDRPSGIALTMDATARTFMVSRPGALPAVSVKPDEGVPSVWSATRRTVAATGWLGANHGVFTVSFASGANENFIEGGAVVATDDSAVYFVAADGLCVEKLP